MRTRRLAVAAAAALLLTGSDPARSQAPAERATQAAPAKRGTPAEAARFVEEAEKKLLELSIDQQRAQWVQSTFITEDTELMAAQANERFIAAGVDFAKRATRFDGLRLPADTSRKLKLLKLALTLPAPGDPQQGQELARIVASMEGAYGRGKWCRKDAAGKDECLDIEALEKILAESRDPKQLLEAWQGWHAISRPYKQDYVRYVELANKGARELGFSDLGAMWRSKYDMPPDAFARELDRLWEQVKPFYASLHAYVRRRLVEKYGPSVVPEKGPIPAHLLGNMWAQQWAEIYPLVAPKDPGAEIDLTQRLQAKELDAQEMVRYGERFFLSLGFEKLPDTFWKRSLFVKPRDREVVCHASAWDVDAVLDLRIKMCIDATAEDFVTIHHELGHNFYQRAYNEQPFLYRDSANDGFHEAVGDTLALSITPSYLQQVGLLDRVPEAANDRGLLLRQALDKVAFLPFGLLIDQWRWKVFSGEVTPERYNQSWWELREKYQGVSAPVARSEQDFDAGAKYHVPANVPYTRYFLAHILQFQFHRALCQAAGDKGPLNRCSIYGNKEAGRRLEAMLAMGASKPWPDALEALTGTREMDASAIADYFAPLKAWLDEQNKGTPVGW
jgi:peptidyl-dipeptidase A